MTQRQHRAWWLLSGLIFIVLFWIALGHQGIASDPQRLRVILFKELFVAIACVMSHCQSESSAFRLLLINGLGNIVVFAPLGISLYAALISEQPAGKHPIGFVALIGLVVSMTFEAIQIWIPGRVVVLDDIVLNTGGAIVGAVVALLVHRHMLVRSRKTPPPL